MKYLIFVKILLKNLKKYKMKTLEKNELKKQLTELVNLSEKLKNNYHKMEIDYFGEDSEETSDLELDERVNNFYNFIKKDYELNSLLQEFNLNISSL